MLQCLGAIVHSGGDAMPVESEGMGEWGKEEFRGKVGELGGNWLWFIWRVRWEEAFA